MHLIMLINVKMPIIVDVSTFIRIIIIIIIINTAPASLKAKSVNIVRFLVFMIGCNTMLG